MSKPQASSFATKINHYQEGEVGSLLLIYEPDYKWVPLAKITFSWHATDLSTYYQQIGKYNAQTR